MNVVLGYAHLLKKAVGTCTCVRREQVDMMLATLDRNGRAQMRLVEDLLDVQRIVAGKFELEYSEFDLQGLSVAVIDSLRPQASAKNLQWAVTIQPLRMRGDAARVQQVLWNLLANAIKFTPDGGSVRMHAARRDGKVVIHVQDSGQGIPAHFLPHGFERFRQLDSSSTRRHYGMGLGLAIVKEVVTRHGGEVTAESPGEGRGSTFVVTLPADHQPPHAQA
jgi:signal transduction histidine kinase